MLMGSWLTFFSQGLWSHFNHYNYGGLGFGALLIVPGGFILYYFIENRQIDL